MTRLNRGFAWGFIFIMISSQSFAGALNKGIVDKNIHSIEIYYTPLDQTSVVPRVTSDVEFRSQHRIISRNIYQSKILEKLFREILNQKGTRQNFDGSLHFSLKINLKEGGFLRIFMDGKGNFEYENYGDVEEFGKIDKQLLNKLVNFCEQNLDTIDLGFQNRMLHSFP